MKNEENIELNDLAWFTSRVGKTIYRTKLEGPLDDLEDAFPAIDQISSLGHAAAIHTAIRGAKRMGCEIEYADSPPVEKTKITVDHLLIWGMEFHNDDPLVKMSKPLAADLSDMKDDMWFGVIVTPDSRFAIEVPGGDRIYFHAEYMEDLESFVNSISGWEASY